MTKHKILFLGESHRADAITWIKGLEEFGGFEIATWELKTSGSGIKNRLLRMLEFYRSALMMKKIAKRHQPDMVIAERTTSYGFLASCSGIHPMAIAQQGRTDIWPEKSLSAPLKRWLQKQAFKKADLIHAWGPVMTISMQESGVNMDKVLILPKGIDLTAFDHKNTAPSNKIYAIVTRSIQPEYRHDIILKAFSILHQKGIDFSLTIIGDGTRMNHLKKLAEELSIASKVLFTGRIPNTELPKHLHQSNLYISMPLTEGVSASLFEAMACGCYPIVSDLPGNQSWIKHRENGQLVTADDFQMLADEILWAYQNPDKKLQAVTNNRKFIEKNANYHSNMKIIAEKYQELIEGPR